jgi:1-acyl-sn-glycerol-3-phosphate acyltransferase
MNNKENTALQSQTIQDKDTAKVVKGVYTFSRRIAKLYLKIYHRYKCFGIENIPKSGGCLLVSNHASFLDPIAIGIQINFRYVRFMARKTLFKNKFTKWWAESVGVVELDREKGSDLNALKKAIKVLKNGDLLAMFPEGTRTPDGNLQPAKGGLGFLALKAGMPVVPAYIDGTFKAFKKGSKFIKPYAITVYYGKPIDLTKFIETGKEYDKVANYIMQCIANCPSLYKTH